VTHRPLDGRKVKALVEQSPKMTPHAIRDDLVILTGDVRQVQEFFRKVVETEDLFGEELKLTRAPAEPAASSAPVAVPDNTRSRTGGASPRPRRK
jgi:hypothetical protein